MTSQRHHSTVRQRRESGFPPALPGEGTVGGYLHLAQGASLDAVLSHLPNKFLAVTDATAHFMGGSGQPTTIERKLMLVNRDHILLVAPRGD